MKIKLIILTLLFNACLFVNSLAQTMPLVYDVENTGADSPKPPLLTFAQLPTINSLPDPFAWADGRGRISSFSDWRYRRAELVEELLYYELGNKPGSPDSDNLIASFSDGMLTVTVVEGTDSLTLTAAINAPSGNGPFPAVIGVGSGTGSLPSDIFTSRGIATIQYNFGEVAPWTQSGRGQGEFYKLYPDTKVGYFTAWAWGISRLIDGLEKVPEANIDLTHLAVTGCSFAGKIALFSGALDERIALTIAQESGGGGDAAWRVTETLDGSRETLSKAQSYGWYYEDVNIFNNAVTKFPYDHHEVMAMIAPRALFLLGNPSQEWLADESGYVASEAAHEVWKALGVPDRFGYSRVGDHPHCQLPSSQRPDVSAFVDKFLLDKDTTNTDISIHPVYASSLSYWIKWTTPVLTEKPSFYGQTSLVFPYNLQSELDTNIIFIWNKVEDAGKYFIQISTDPIFKNPAIIDSTADTVHNVINLLAGKRYYWRIQVKNNNGLFGPWSNVFNFTTFISLPDAPQLASVTPYPNRPGWFTFKWKKTKNASNYSIQVSEVETFNAIFMSASTSDTLKIFDGFSVEGKKFYWRVQAKNVAGSGPWSKASIFNSLPAPTNLMPQKTAANEITLTWNDNSASEDGFVIERAQAPQNSFTLIDSLNANTTEYIDKNVEQSQSYTYRVKAYKDSVYSDYSNEAYLVLVGINNEEKIRMEYSLSQNYPNPFNPITKIEFSMPKSELLKLTIYNLQGGEVKILLNKELNAGYHEINFNASNLESGVYFYRMQAGNFTETKKLLLIK